MKLFKVRQQCESGGKRDVNEVIKEEGTVGTDVS